MHQSLRQTVNNKYQTWGKIFYALYITINILWVSGEYMFLGEQNKPDVLQEKLSQWYLTETIDHCLWDVSVKINQSKQITWHHDTHILWVLCKEYSKEYSNIISLSILGSVFSDCVVFYWGYSKHCYHQAKPTDVYTSPSTHILLHSQTLVGSPLHLSFDVCSLSIAAPNSLPPDLWTCNNKILQFLNGGAG